MNDEPQNIEQENFEGKTFGLIGQRAWDGPGLP